MKKFMVYVGIVFSLFFLWLALKDVVFHDVKNAFANANLLFIFPILFCQACFFCLKAVRWSVILSPNHTVSSMKLAPSMMAGAAGNNLLPAHFGEFVRVYYSAKQFDIAKSTVLASLVVERLLDMLAVLTLFSVAIVVGGYSTAMIAAGSALLAIAIVVAVTAALFVVYVDQCVGFIRHRLTVPSSALRHKIADQLVHLGKGLAALRDVKLYLSIIVNSLLQWLLMAGCVYFSFLALNIDASIWLAVVVLGLIIVGLTLPTAPGFFGTIEYCFVLGLTMVGIDPSIAISAGIFYHIPSWIAVIAVGLTLARYNNFSFKTVNTHSEK